MKTILVTGCAGLIGCETSKQLLEQGNKIIGIDNLNDYYDVDIKKYRITLLEKYPEFAFFHLDIVDQEAVKALFKNHQFDAIINLAARAGVRYSMENPHVYVDTNITGTVNLLEGMKDFGIKKLVLASTSSLYSGLPMPFTETLQVNTPISPYAASKKAAEMMCHTYHYLYDLDITIVRYFTVYGPAGRPDMSYYRFIQWVDREQPIIVYGDGEQSRDFTYVGDIAKGTIKALKPLGYEIINLGGGKNPITINHIIKVIEEYLGKKAKIDYKEAHVADMRTTWANIEKAGKLLNWKPEIKIEEGLRNCVDWYLENKNWLKDIELK